MYRFTWQFIYTGLSLTYILIQNVSILLLIHLFGFHTQIKSYECSSYDGYVIQKIKKILLFLSNFYNNYFLIPVVQRRFLSYHFLIL